METGNGALGSGCDALHHISEFLIRGTTEKFDPKFIYIKKWVKRIWNFTYPKPIIEHKFVEKEL